LTLFTRLYKDAWSIKHKKPGSMSALLLYLWHLYIGPHSLSNSFTVKMITALYDEMEEPTPHVVANFKSWNYTLGVHVLHSVSDVLFFSCYKILLERGVRTTFSWSYAVFHVWYFHFQKFLRKITVSSSSLLYSILRVCSLQILIVLCWDSYNCNFP